MRCWLFCLCFMAYGAVSADERILSFHSKILVRADGWIEVTETIRIRAEHNRIRFGIYRDYPVRYKDNLGNSVVVLYEPQSVLRNGLSENFHSEPLDNGHRTYFGTAGRLVEKGEHTYTYHYNAGRMLGFFESADEIYWNVTGDDWDFRIDAASATVRFEFDPPQQSLTAEAYVGYRGSTGNADYETNITETGEIQFRTTRPLGHREGLTIVAGWPKGFVIEPTSGEKAIWLLKDNLSLFVAIAGLLAMITYYIPVWSRYGKDPEPGAIVPLYEPPAGFSPASLRYIENSSYDNKTMTAAVLSLAVKGYLRVDVTGKSYKLVKIEPPMDAPPLATGERAFYEKFFVGERSLVLTDSNYSRIGPAIDAHKESLHRDYRDRYFKLNRSLNLPPLIVGICAIVVALLIGATLSIFIVAALMFVTMLTFVSLMKRPTEPGRQILDQAAGFREYLEIAEKDELNLRNPPEKTPALFEAYLPFALALGVEQQWSERFARIFAEHNGPNSTEWSPAWYGGTWNNFDIGSNTSTLSSDLGDAISSSASPPGSSSGSSFSSGGGGFSGGGGGGGGGGGW